MNIDLDDLDDMMDDFGDEGDIDSCSGDCGNCPAGSSCSADGEPESVAEDGQLEFDFGED